MSDKFGPIPWQVPTPGGVQRPVSMQTTVTYPADANRSDKNVLFRVAGEIVDQNSNAVYRFMANNRMQQSLTKNDYMDRFIKLDKMNVRWRINQGQEKLDIEVFPAGGQEVSTTTSETNLDGYVAWIHCDPSYPDLTSSGSAQFIGPFNILFNGYLIEQDFQPAGPTGGYPILFGKTALLCSSYVGDKEDLNPLVHETTLKQPNKIVPPIGWDQYKAGSSPIGQEQQAYNKAFGYWIFDWLNILNECQYLYPFGVGSGYQDWEQITSFTGKGAAPAPVFTKGFYFKSSQPNQSPLLPKGKNAMSAILSPQAKGSSEIVNIDIFIAEFYDRGKYRSASQSWTIASKDRQTIAINDSPMIFGGAIWSGGFSPGAGFTFDLDPQVTKNFHDTNGGGQIDGTDDDLQLGPHDGLLFLSASNQYAAFTILQQQEYDAWAAQVRQDAADFEAMIQAEVKPLEKKMHDTVLPAYQNAYKLAVVARQIAGNVKLFESQFPDYVKNGLYWDAPTQKFSVPLNGNGPVKDDVHGLGAMSVETQNLYIGGDGNYHYTDDFSFTYGPHQEYYMDLTIPFIGGYASNLASPTSLLQILYVQLSTTETTEPPPPYPPPPAPPVPQIITTITTTYGTATYSFLNSGMQGLSGTYLGPYTYAGLLDFALQAVPQAVKDYVDLSNQIQKILNQPPPNSPPFPNLGDDLGRFKYSEISISGEWSYDQ